MGSCTIEYKRCETNYSNKTPGENDDCAGPAAGGSTSRGDRQRQAQAGFSDCQGHLGKRFGVAPGSIREAINILAQKGFFAMASPHISPPIHHQNTTFFSPISPNPQQNTTDPRPKKSQTLSGRLRRNCRRLLDSKDLIRTNIIQPLHNAARPMNLNRFHYRIRPEPEVSTFVVRR